MRPRFRFVRPLLLALSVLVTAGFAQEVQRHGIVFEAWVRETFFGGYKPQTYTQKWDIPPEANQEHGAIAVNPKAAKYGTAVDLGDALRQFDIGEPFILVIGYWRQEGDRKRFVKIVAPRIEPAQWRSLWGPVTRADLEQLDAVIKDRSLSPEQARAAARKMKSRPPFTEAVFVLNPKIDSKSQRRLQCSLRFSDVFARLLPDADRSPDEQPALWGVPFEHTIPSKPRTYNP